MTRTQVLSGIEMEVRAGELLVVCGPVGGGKSSLLGAILGETKKDTGRVWLSGRVSYAAQQPWIMNATLKDNILFGAPFDEDRYAAVLAACALLPDMQVPTHAHARARAHTHAVHTHTHTQSWPPAPSSLTRRCRRERHRR